MWFRGHVALRVADSALVYVHSLLVTSQSLHRVGTSLRCTIRDGQRMLPVCSGASDSRPSEKLGETDSVC